jgi:4'-phosphopantetheinyl transferase
MGATWHRKIGHVEGKMQVVKWVPAPKSLDLADGEIHVWRAALNSPLLACEFHSTLATDELERAARFKFERDRIDFVVARGVLRELLGAYVGLPPKQLNFSYSALGKPSLITRSQICFNVAHSRGLALYAFARERALGIDVEWIRPHVATDELARLSFTRRELVAWRALPSSIRTREFFTRWTCKEAYAKARGVGLRVPLDSLELELTGKEGRIRVQGADTGWHVVPLLAAESYPAALSYQAAASRIRFFSVRTKASESEHPA